LALATHDLDKPDGRARAAARLREVLSEAATPIERDEELRYIADALQLSTESVSYLLKAGGRPEDGRTAAQGRRESPRGGGTTAAIGGAHELEVRFLAGCLAQPEKGRAVLAGLDESFFASAETRVALGSVKARLAVPEAGNTLHAPDDGAGVDDGGTVLAEVIVRSGRERFTDVVVDELFLRLQDAQLGRLIARLKVAMQGDETERQARELAKLEAARRRLREALRAIPVGEEPREG
jgi:DNA primase